MIAIALDAIRVVYGGYCCCTGVFCLFVFGLFCLLVFWSFGFLAYMPLALPIAKPGSPEGPPGTSQPTQAAAAGSTAGAGDEQRPGGATGTETPQTGPANRRTTTGQPHQPAQAAAKAVAAARQENPATTTTPENDRTDSRNRHRHEPAANADPTTRRQGAATSGAAPTRWNTKEEAATTHPRTGNARARQPSPAARREQPLLAREGPRTQWAA